MIDNVKSLTYLSGIWERLPVGYDAVAGWQP
jgi:hypothetical protein